MAGQFCDTPGIQSTQGRVFKVYIYVTFILQVKQVPQDSLVHLVQLVELEQQAGWVQLAQLEVQAQLGSQVTNLLDIMCIISIF